MKELTPEERKEHLKGELSFANLGKQVLNNEAYKEAIAVRKAELFSVFCDTALEQSAERDEAWRGMQNLRALEQYLYQLLGTGKLAEQDLKRYED